MQSPPRPEMAPPLAATRGRAKRWIVIFLCLVVAGGALLLVRAKVADGPTTTTDSNPAVPFATVQLPAPPTIEPRHAPPRPPRGRTVDPLEQVPIYELPTARGLFRHEGVSFRYPKKWELVSSGGYHGLIGNNLWLTSIGVSPEDHVLVMANYFPWKYSDRQMREEAETVVESVVAAEGGRVLRPPTPVETAGITVHWSDIASTTPTGDSLTRIFHFAWNDVEYYFACKQNMANDVEIIRGCDQLISTLQLGVYD